MRIGTMVAGLALVAPWALADDPATSDALPATKEALPATKEALEELRRENAALAEKVARLERLADDQGRWLTEARAEEIREVVKDTLADAQTRASLLADGATAGWDRNFFLASADGNFRLRLRGQIQFRYAYNHRDIDDGDIVPGGFSTRESTSGFENRRTKLDFDGHVIDPSIRYCIQMAFNRSASDGQNSFLEDAYVTKEFEGGWSVQAGQQKAPFLAEELMSSRTLLAVERSLVNDVFTTQYVQGFQLSWETERLHFHAMYSDALRANRADAPTGTGLAGSVGGSINTDYRTNPVSYAVSGRVEFLAAGSWSQFRSSSSPRGEAFGLRFGAAAYAQSLRDAPDPTDASDIWAVTADVAAKFGGANLFAYGVYRQVTLAGDVPVRGGGTDDAMDQWAVVVQGGVFVHEDIELFARYEFGDLDTDRFRTAAAVSRAEYERNGILTVGVNVFPAGVKRSEIKWTTDLGFAFDPIGDFAASGADWASDGTTPGGSTESGQIVIRSQVQLLF